MSADRSIVGCLHCETRAAMDGIYCPYCLAYLRTRYDEHGDFAAHPGPSPADYDDHELVLHTESPWLTLAEGVAS